MKGKHLFIVLAAGLAAGCMTGDPASDGFLGGLVHLADGTYEHRRIGLEEHAAAGEVQHRQLTVEQRTLAQQQADLQEKAEQLSAGMSEMDDEARRLQALLDGHMTATTEAQAEKQVLLAQLQRQREEMQLIQSGSAEYIAAKEEEINRMEAELEKLREQTLLLMGI